KWKTTVQMVAIAMLFATGAFDHYFQVQSLAMTEQMVIDAIEGTGPDELGLRWKYYGLLISWWGGIITLWLAALLTLITGWDYFTKSRPYLTDKPS
ncbi:MAG: CDP-diacylglycerol--glycerol-3-phosphate 3-phosphatidyltransferase, partial [Pseudomonadota bacterium]